MLLLLRKQYYLQDVVIDAEWERQPSPPHQQQTEHDNDGSSAKVTATSASACSAAGASDAQQDCQLWGPRDAFLYNYFLKKYLFIVFFGSQLQMSLQNESEIQPPSLSLSLRCSARGEEAREVPDGQVRRAPDGAHQEAAARRDVDVREAARVVRRGKADYVVWRGSVIVPF